VDTVITGSVLARLGGALGCLLLVTGCATNIHESEDFERHRNSQLVIPYARPDVIYFDARFSPAIPDADPAAEARRMAWLAAWLEARKLCPAGFDVVDRRPFDFLEDNPARFDIRYEVACKQPPAPAGEIPAEAAG
jgi:hypothetical protein